ncbi:GMC oxidoreductase-domain-containing protein [Hygrophoropsis aurantiaca]|uniref:GMC oxidoreductase-domain-containing protein n=1 Tax=Hygrophoropsis aurantiaca TaxID=72124 RepID=A0ACB8APU8_9AGAM|nr:GMC oxidoreductase-domain-containing protein [Hygrophoropsis aurantiaca]
MSPTVEYDIIFAGGGTTACLVAGRLAAANPTLRILILEAGPHTKDVENHTLPSRCLDNVEPGSNSTFFNAAETTPSLGGRPLIVHSGRCVGGGSNINFMMYTRAAASDYDDWETLYHNPGWGSKDLLPLLKKTETYQIKDGAPTHGYSGPLKVSYGGVFTDVGRQALDVAAKYDPERSIAEDSNDLMTCNAYSRWQKWIDGTTGKRSDTAHYFIYNQESNKNLQTLPEKVVKRVLIENGRAVGVEYTNDLVLSPNADQTIFVARATQLVVVSAGAFGSPSILERSGIGAKDVLDKNGVPQLVDLPGVGENYQDHPVAFPAYFADDNAETLDALYRGDKKVTEEQMALWSNDGTGLVAHNAYDVAIKVRPSIKELQELGPEFESKWTNFFAGRPDKSVVLLAPCSGLIGNHSVVPERAYIGACYYLCYPDSIGSVHITSGDNPHTPQRFYSGFLDSPSDLAILRLAYKRMREWIRRMPSYRGEYQPLHPVFPEGSAAACKESNGPAAIDSPDIVYTAEDDKAIETFHREIITSARHSLGTCAMKPRAAGGVVDSHLNVYGVHGLKVADLSVVPSNIAANTYSSALVIGEKAAVTIAEELNLLL